MKRVQHLCALALALGTTLPGRAQSGTVATGGDASGPGGSISSSIGQVGYRAVVSAGGTVGEGVQQAYEYLVLPVYDQVSAWMAFVSPNPTSDGITVQLTDVLEGKPRFELLDAEGQLVRAGQLASSHAFIPMQELPSASYLLLLYHAGGDHTVFKILKQ
ncbi:MAG: T9SS type A sorting domain-containing protein [Flavobacteriales bacterium]|nr:T9SS type A sorting domain-containing protein [Flavobacteriales bacterium]